MQLRDGQLLTGVNYWCSTNAMEMWRRWDAAAVERDFAALAANGCTLVRCFTRWDDFQPITMFRTPAKAGGQQKEIRLGDAHLPDTPEGRCGLSEEMLGHFDEFCELAERYGLKLIVAMLTGQMTFGLFVPQALTGVDLYHDPLALMWEERFLRGFVTRMRRHAAIWAWESGNEANLLGGAPTREGCWVWTKWIHGAIRAADPTRPVIGISVDGIVWNSQAPGRGWMLEDQGELSDYLTVHPYGMWSNASLEEFSHLRQLMFCVARNRVAEDIGGKPSFVEETGLWRPIATSKRLLGETARAMLWNQWRDNCRAMLWWCAFDQESFDMAPYDWREPGLEHGIMTSDRRNMPIADTLRGFTAFLRTLPFEALPPVRTDAVCLISDFDQAYGAWILARQAGVNLRFRATTQELPPSDIYLMPSAAARDYLTTTAWERLLAAVRAGATLYLGLEDTYLTHLEDVTGVGIVGRRAWGRTERIAFEGFSFEVPLSVRYEFELEGARVLATDGSGSGQCFEHRYGAGRVITLGFPLERICLAKTGLFEGEAHRLYELLVPKRRVVGSGNGKLIVTEHPFADGRLACVLVNNTPEPMDEALTLADGWRVTGQFSDLPAARLAADGRVSLPGGAGLLLTLER